MLPDVMFGASDFGYARPKFLIQKGRVDARPVYEGFELEMSNLSPSLERFLTSCSCISDNEIDG